MSESQHISAEFPYHVLDFFYDSDDGCALTVLLHGKRYHVIADAGKVGCQPASPSSETAQEYVQLLQQVRTLDDKQDPSDSNAESDDESGSAAADSGIDMTAPKLDGSLNNVEKALHAWMLAPLASTFEDAAPKEAKSGDTTLDQWYDCPTSFFELEIYRNKLKAVEVEATQELQDRMRKLIPTLKIPKYIRDIDIPWYSASDLDVISCSDELAAYHPCRVRLKDSSDEKTYFIKLVDEPGPNKREMKLLNRIAQLDLHTEIRCPKLEAFVTFSSPTAVDYSRNNILGFLQTDIKNPVPLTHKLDASIPQEQREKWAAEADKTKAALHKNGIIWGDAKADNFMVDEDGELWIIDFGGSYTEGWVDKELNETVEGDNMGVLKIVNALEDPIANTIGSDEDEDNEEEPEEVTKKPQGRKRKAMDDSTECVTDRNTKAPRLSDTQPSDEHESYEENDAEQSTNVVEQENDKDEEEEDSDDSYNEDEEVGMAESKGHGQINKAEQVADDADTPIEHDKAKSHEAATTEEPTFCYCQGPSSGEMIACDNSKCSKQWFHFTCADIASAPPEGEKWYCRDCT